MDRGLSGGGSGGWRKTGGKELHEEGGRVFLPTVVCPSFGRKTQKRKGARERIPLKTPTRSESLVKTSLLGVSGSLLPV